MDQKKCIAGRSVSKMFDLNAEKRIVNVRFTSQQEYKKHF